MGALTLGEGWLGAYRPSPHWLPGCGEHCAAQGHCCSLPFVSCIPRKSVPGWPQDSWVPLWPPRKSYSARVVWSWFCCSHRKLQRHNAAVIPSRPVRTARLLRFGLPEVQARGRPEGGCEGRSGWA